MSAFTEAMIYLGVIFLGILMVLFTIIAYFVVKFYKAGNKQNDLINEIRIKLEKIQAEIRNKFNK